MPISGFSLHRDLHAFVESGSSTIEFRVTANGLSVRVDVTRATLNARFGVTNSSHGLLGAYEAHRAEIDDAVIRRATSGGIGVVKVRPKDF